MPTYQYRCRECGHELEVQQSFSDDALTECPSCAGALRKVFSAVGISFKGSGFYKTDSRGGSSRSGSSSTSTGSSDSGSGDSGSGASDASSTGSDSSSSTPTSAPASTPSSTGTPTK